MGLRDLRHTADLRDKNAEVALSVEDFICPLFLTPGAHQRQAIHALPGIFRYSLDQLPAVAEELLVKGIRKVLLFGMAAAGEKDEVGRAAFVEDNLVAKAVLLLKNNFPEFTVFTDVCVCAYTNHGHCGVVRPLPVLREPQEPTQELQESPQEPSQETRGESHLEVSYEVSNEHTLPVLAQMAISHAKAGADFVCPSAMMDYQVAAIREALDAEGYTQTKILSYSAKFASGFYGPFREAVDSKPSFGDRKGYQLDYRTKSQALEETKTDIEEGADWVMVKPAHSYLDVITKIKLKYPEKTLAAYHVSGEFAMLRLAGKEGLVDEFAAVAEVLTAIKRAGADYIISYYAYFINEGLQLKN